MTSPPSPLRIKRPSSDAHEGLPSSSTPEPSSPFSRPSPTGTPVLTGSAPSSPAPPLRLKPSPIDYSRFERIASSTEEEEALLSAVAQDVAEKNVGRAVRKSAVPTVASGLPEEFSLEDVENLRLKYKLEPAVARFAKICEPKPGAPDNVNKYQFIIDAIRESPELLKSKAVSSSLIEAINKSSEAGSDEEGAILITALNTLEACKARGVLELFSEIASPKTEAAKQLRMKYIRREFAKEAMLRNALGDEQYDKLMREAEEDDDEDDVNGTVVMVIVVLVATLILVAVGVVYRFDVLS